MLRHLAVLPLLLSTLLLAASPADAQFRAIHQPFSGPVTAAKIRIAVDDSVMFLRSRQAEDGSIPSGAYTDGGTALAALTMLAAGAHPATGRSAMLSPNPPVLTISETAINIRLLSTQAPRPNTGGIPTVSQTSFKPGPAR